MTPMTNKLRGRATYRCWDAVRMFHVANGAVINDQPIRAPMNQFVTALRLRLILEELGETMVAYHTNNLVELADGLADLKYVVLGTAVSFGIQVEDSFQAPGPLVQTVLPRHTCQASAVLVSCLGDLVAALKNCTLCECDDPGCECKALDERDLPQLQYSLAKMDYAISREAEVLGLPLEEVFWEVHRANLSKKLGGAKAGEKYPEGGGKHEGYTPPNVAGILERAEEAQSDPS